MRRYVLILMLVLLPLRGWVGEAMAMQMLAQHVDAIQMVAAPTHGISAEVTFYTEMQAECHGADHGASEANHADAAPDTPHCGSCPLCQMCHSVAAPAPWAVCAPLWLAHALPATGHARFASAPAAFALKPPIS